MSSDTKVLLGMSKDAKVRLGMTMHDKVRLGMSKETKIWLRMSKDSKVWQGISKDANDQGRQRRETLKTRLKCGYGWMRADYGEVRIVTFI